MIYDLTGKVALITGASQGFGFEIAKGYLLSGAKIMICGRDEDALRIAHQNLAQINSSNISSQVGDVSNSIDAKNLVETTLDKFSGLHVLVNNAGIYGPKDPIESVNWDDWIKAININLLGSVLMSKNVIKYMKMQKSGKIIQISGGGATSPLPNLSAYAASKAAIVRFAETLALELRGTGIDVNSLAPGALNTRLLDEIIEAGPAKVGAGFYAKALEQKENGGTPFKFGVDLSLFLASNFSNGITGKLISANWDNWKEWPRHVEELNNSDVYTLRRIIGSDRLIGWGDIS